MPSSPRPASRMSWTVKGEQVSVPFNWPCSFCFNVISMARTGTYCFTTNSSWSMSSSPAHDSPCQRRPRGGARVAVVCWKMRWAGEKGWPWITIQPHQKTEAGEDLKPGKVYLTANAALHLHLVPMLTWLHLVALVWRARSFKATIFCFYFYRVWNFLPPFFFNGNFLTEAHTQTPLNDQIF